MRKIFARVIIYSLVSSLVLFAGCTRRIKSPPPHSDDATIKLAEAATSVSNSLKKLARIQAAATPPVKGKHLPDPNTSGMTGIASIDWAGPIGPLVTKIAQASKYKVRVLGKTPAIPIIVSVNAKNTPLASILRDVDYQAGKRAHIVVYPHKRVIELRYNRG